MREFVMVDTSHYDGNTDRQTEYIYYSDLPYIAQPFWAYKSL